MRVPIIDVGILVGYLVLVVGAGAWLARRSGNTASFMAGNRAMPGWAIGLSMFGSYISSVSFLANPGKAFGGDWNAFVFTLCTPIAAIAAVLWFVPFYRRRGSVSAFEHFEHRFGRWARTYAVVCFLLAQMGRMGMILFLLAKGAAPLLAALFGAEDAAWLQPAVIIVIGSIMTLNVLLGGMQAVVWLGVIQSMLLLVGPVICLAAILYLVPGGIGRIVTTGIEHGKFALGSTQLGGVAVMFGQATFWVVLLNGIVTNLSNFSVDQSYVQRYISAASDREARKSVLITAGFYVPTAAFFFFIGTGLYALHVARPELFPGNVVKDADGVFPYFISHLLPVGLGGLVIAGIFAAAMDPNLNAMATLTFNDIYKPYLRPNASEKESMFLLHAGTGFWGVMMIAVALWAAGVQNRAALDLVWELAGLFSGGILGVLILGAVCPRADGRSAAAGVILGVTIILWMYFSTKSYWPEALRAIRSPFHSFMIVVIGNLATLIGGLLWTWMFAQSPAAPRRSSARPNPDVVSRAGIE
ncbi:sodium:solute symporter family transporter [Fontivita pretiosa]|uniref:sodium:solute symporter family transporter n=1 Tax=Fontivita pretiosa TaxID=2989684 RepID=UPI003D17E56A